MNCQVKRALFPFDDTSFWSDLFNFCKEYGEYIYVNEMELVALSDQIANFNLPLVEQPTVVNKGYGIMLEEYTLMQGGNSWEVLKGEVVVAVLNSWESLAEQPELDEELSALILTRKEEKAKQRKAFLDEFAPVVEDEEDDDGDQDEGDGYWF